MDVFAANLRKRAANLGLSNAEVARRVGLSDRRYGNYVIGRREPDLATLKRIAEVLASSVDDLLSGERIPEESTAELLAQRLRSAAQVLDKRDMELIVVQVEAAAILRSTPAS